MDPEQAESEARKRLIKISLETGECPIPGCGAEIEHVGMHERDSSNDRHYCPKCGWGYGEMESWGLKYDSGV